MLSTAQKCWIRTIHTAKTKLKLSDEGYRALLQGAAQINSSKEIKTWVQYDSIMSAFQKLGFTLCKQKVDPQSARHPDWLSAKQEKYIRGLWSLVSREKSEQSLNSFVEKITGRGHVTWLLKSDAAKVINALRKMAVAQGINPDKKEN